MKRKQDRASAEGYCIQLLIINGEIQDQSSQLSFNIENISKGGFRFISDISFQLEDRVQVLLRFPDGHDQEVSGRICYSDQLDNKQAAYGFSIIEGFYSLQASNN